MTKINDADLGYDSQVVRHVRDRHNYSPEEIRELETAFAEECWDNAPVIQRTREVYGDNIARNDLARLKHRFRRYVNSRSAKLSELRDQAFARKAEREAEQAKAREAKLKQAEAKRQAEMEAAKAQAKADWLAAGGTAREFEDYGWEQMRQREMVDRATELDRRRKAATSRRYRELF